jgi:hypothetical protein
MKVGFIGAGTVAGTLAKLGLRTNPITDGGTCAWKALLSCWAVYV